MSKAISEKEQIHYQRLNAERFAKFNRKNIQDRQIDTLIGLAKGITADDHVNQEEAEFIFTWLIQNKHSENPIILNLFSMVSDMLEDGVLDAEESKELLKILRSITGDKSAPGELSKTSSLPVDRPMPRIHFVGKNFLFTGTCAFGPRKKCQEAVIKLGGVVLAGVTRRLDYLVLGAYVTDSWADEPFGRKIEQAREYQSKGVPISIITEEHWAGEADLI